MSSAETHYFALLRAALWDSPVDIEEEIDWDAVMRLAKHHATLVLLSGVASQMTGSNRPNDALCVQMQTAMRNNLFQHLQLKSILVSAFKLLREHNIEPVLLKGFGLAMLYPNPNLRQFGDIDLFVGLDDFHKACKLLRSLPGSYNWGEETDAGHHYNIEFGQFPMEVHRLSAEVTGTKETAVYMPIEHNGLIENARRVDCDGFDITVPSVEFQVFYTFYHAWHHFLNSGVGWRQVSDVTMALHAYHEQIDRDKLRQWLDAMHLMEPWQTFGWLMVNTLGLPEKEMPFYSGQKRRKAQKLYRRIMKEGNFKRNSNFKRKAPKRRIWHKAHAFIGIFVDFFYRAKIFPSAAFRELKAALGESFSKMRKE